MSIISTKTKGKAGLKAAKAVAKRPQLLADAAHTIGDVLAVQGPQAAYELGLADPPKPKRTVPRVVAGILIGAGAVYFLEPEHGAEHRRKVAQIVG
jgi:hypothetical protein